MADEAASSIRGWRVERDFDYIGKLRNVINEREAPAFPRDAEFAKLVDLPSCFTRRLDALARQDMLNRMVAEAGPQSTAMDFANAVQAIECCTGGVDSGLRNWAMATRLAGILFEARGAATDDVTRWLKDFTPGVVTVKSEEEGEDAPFGDEFRFAQAAASEFANHRWWRHRATYARSNLVTLGSAPLDAEGRGLLRDAHAQRDENVRTLQLACAFALLSIAFVIAFRSAPAAGGSLLVQAVLCVLLVLAVLVMAFRFFKRTPFDSMGGVVPALYLLWLLFAFAAVLV